VGRVEFALGQSKGLSLFFLLIYAGAISIIISLPWVLIIKILCIVALLYHTSKTLNLHARRISKNAVVRVWKDPKGRWGYQTKDGKRAIGSLKNDSYKSAHLIILRFRLSTHSRNVIIPLDALNSSEYRVLCTHINFS